MPWPVDVWDGYSRVRQEDVVRAPAGLDWSEITWQIQQIQFAIQGGDPQTAINTTNIATNVTDIGTNTTDIANLTIVVGNNTTDIANLTIVVGDNTTDIANLTIVVGDNTTDIANLTIVVGDNTTDIANLTIVVGNNTTNIGINTGNISTNTTNIGTNAANILTNAQDIVALTLSSGIIEVTNKETTAIVICTPVYSSGSAEVKKAKANAFETSKVTGLIKDETIASDATGDIITTGILTATTTQWDAATGETGGLSSNTIYYLSVSSGLITALSPSNEGEVVIQIGESLSTTQMRVSIQPPIIL